MRRHDRLPLGTAQDHKRACDGDRGPNTGGMGAYSPAPVLTRDVEARVMREIVEPTLAGMGARGTPFVGILYAGLMITADGPKLIEYNVRFGDPECQVLMPRMKSDLVTALLAACDGVLRSFDVRWWDDAALTVVDGRTGLSRRCRARHRDPRHREAAALEDVLVFQAGTRQDGTASSPMAAASSASRRRARRSPKRRRAPTRPSTGSIGPKDFAAAISAGARCNAGRPDLPRRPGRSFGS